MLCRSSGAKLGAVLEDELYLTATHVVWSVGTAIKAPAVGCDSGFALREIIASFDSNIFDL